MPVSCFIGEIHTHKYKIQMVINIDIFPFHSLNLFYTFVGMNIIKDDGTLHLSWQESIVTPYITVRRGQINAPLHLWPLTQQWYPAHCTTMNQFWGVKLNLGVSSWQWKQNSPPLFHHFVISKTLLSPWQLKTQNSNVMKKRAKSTLPGTVVFVCVFAIKLLHRISPLEFMYFYNGESFTCRYRVILAGFSGLAVQQNSFTSLYTLCNADWLHILSSQWKVNNIMWNKSNPAPYNSRTSFVIF